MDVRIGTSFSGRSPGSTDQYTIQQYHVFAPDASITFMRRYYGASLFAEGSRHCEEGKVIFGVHFFSLFLKFFFILGSSPISRHHNRVHLHLRRLRQSLHVQADELARVGRRLGTALVRVRCRLTHRHVGSSTESERSGHIGRNWYSKYWNRHYAVAGEEV